ncbi:MAG TPA: hypothetical protein VFT74_18930 [Isosphaeraceae bacterium]|nr:hypothetical protein [Isosphaeraceae bacterium]
MSRDIVEQNLIKEGKRIHSKWAKTGLLEGLDDKKGPLVARLMENQLKQFLKEASSTADIIGFQNVAFPIIRRVFAGLIANELVSVQPMSLPSGLLFYMDYRYDTVKAGNQADDFTAGGSLFGDRNSLQDAKGSGGPYNFSPSFSLREKVSTALFSATLAPLTLADIEWDPELSSSLNVSTTGWKKLTLTNAYAAIQASGGLSNAAELKTVMPLSGSSTSANATSDGTPVRVGVTTASGLKVFRRFTKVNPDGVSLDFVVSGTSADVAGTAYVAGLKISYPVAPTLTGGTSGTLVLDPNESDLGQPTAMPSIPELDFRIESVAVTAKSRKLKARWTPELAQDLAAYQNLDAEVELTQVLSEQIALEIDREILAELLFRATGANYFWSRAPGKFLDKTNGTTATGSTFTGTVREWYETLIEVIIDVGNTIQRKTLRGAANFLVTSPDVSTILEASVLYKPIFDAADTMQTTMGIGTEKVGTLSQRYTVYKDPYFPRNKILVGYKGSSFLETGFVYAPYVPLIVTPVIYKYDDLTPTKGVMTRYAKQLVRSDFYGTVTVMDMNYP